ncbi:MAG: hypothetical protein LBF89_11180 [Bacteroidales bacterium]|jgi:hypothetical protein|nr:hypothetical protein [Bacteroidales bacterium]
MKKYRQNVEPSPGSYAKIGRLSMPVAKAIRRKAAYIYIDENHLQHIFINHCKELSALGFDALTFVKLVVTNYNRIYRGAGNSLLLVIYNGNPKVTAIELNIALKKGFYEVKTATVMSKIFLQKKELLWPKQPRQC